MLIETLSVFPEMFEPVMSTSILGRARCAGIFDFRAYDLRDWTHDRHRTVDDAPFGGGQGMLMKAPPIFEAVRSIASEGRARTSSSSLPAASRSSKMSPSASLAMSGCCSSAGATRAWMSAPMSSRTSAFPLETTCSPEGSSLPWS